MKLRNVTAPGDWHAALLRVTETLIGRMLALLIAYVLRPHSAPINRPAEELDTQSA